MKNTNARLTGIFEQFDVYKGRGRATHLPNFVGGQ